MPFTTLLRNISIYFNNTWEAHSFSTKLMPECLLDTNSSRFHFIETSEVIHIDHELVNKIMNDHMHNVDQ